MCVYGSERAARLTTAAACKKAKQMLTATDREIGRAASGARPYVYIIIIINVVSRAFFSAYFCSLLLLLSFSLSPLS